MAKHLASSYLPGRRAPAWRKIKPVVELSCVIIGYLPGSRGPSAFLVAALENGRLRYVGKLSQGISPELRASLATMLAERTCREPTVPCTEKAVWVRPELVCEVRCLGRTGGGHLRSPRLQSFLGVRGGWQE
jgi:bifunctional non-homologous end joining protein LigD